MKTYEHYLASFDLPELLDILIIEAQRLKNALKQGVELAVKNRPEDEQTLEAQFALCLQKEIELNIAERIKSIARVI